MNDIILLKLGELVLKGLNRHNFEEKLMSNARRRLRSCGGRFKVTTKQSITYVEPLEDACDMDRAFEAMKMVFGAAGVCRCRACEKDKDVMLSAIQEFLAPQLAAAKTFKVECKRSDKAFPLNSIQLAQYLGGDGIDDQIIAAQPALQMAQLFSAKAHSLGPGQLVVPPGSHAHL